MQDRNLEKGAAIPPGLETRVREAVKLAGGPPVVAKATGSGVSSVYNYMKMQPPPSIAWCFDLAKLAEVRAAWLFTGEMPQREGEDAPGATAANENQANVPLMEFRVSAGGGRTAIDREPIGYVSFPLDWLESLGPASSLELTQVEGDSMEPEFGSGDYVLYDKGRTKLADGLFVLRLDDDLLVKRVQVEGRYVQLISNNKEYHPTRIDREADAHRFTVIGRVVWTGKRRAT